MTDFFAIAGCLWISVAVGSFLLGPLVGFNRQQVISELAAFRKLYVSGNLLSRIVHLSIYWVAYVCFLLPATKPVIGLPVGIAFLIAAAVF